MFEGSDDLARATIICKRITLCGGKDAGFRFCDPGWCYCVMTDISAFGYKDDVEFSKFLVKDIGVAVVPGSSFYHEPELGRSQVRFTFCKRDETLAAAEERLQKLESIAR
ncbi:MAG: hypothetical protein AABO57_24090 [Acidobacteriota bacterium]